MFSAAKELHFSILFRLCYFWWGQISARIYLSIMASRRRCDLWPVGWWVPTFPTGFSKASTQRIGHETVGWAEVKKSLPACQVSCVRGPQSIVLFGWLSVIFVYLGQSWTLRWWTKATTSTKFHGIPCSFQLKRKNFTHLALHFGGEPSHAC